jgi:transcriptional regulator with XRE-family HTH domain
LLKDFVKEYRQAHGLTQADLAKIAELSNSFICRIERGDYKSLSFNSITKLARATKLSMPALQKLIDLKKTEDLSGQQGHSFIKETNTPYILVDKNPLDLVRELTNSLPELIPLYNKISDKKVVGYAYYPQPTPKYRGGDMKLIGIRSHIKYKDEIRPGDVLVVAKELKPDPGDLCIRDNKEGIEVCTNDGLPIITIIREKKKIV